MKLLMLPLIIVGSSAVTSASIAGEHQHENHSHHHASHSDMKSEQAQEKPKSKAWLERHNAKYHSEKEASVKTKDAISTQAQALTQEVQQEASNEITKLEKKAEKTWWKFW